MKRLLPLLLLTAMLVPAASAQQKKAPAPAPLIEPLQPVLAWIYPAGGQRGTTLEVTASGTSIVPETVLVTGGGVTGKLIDGSTPNKVKLSLTIAPDAALGERELRILNAGGISNRFRFIVGELKEITEIEPNSDKSSAQKLPALPLVIDGQILEVDRDCFRFAAKSGETLVFSVQARSLLPYIADAVPGWFDPQLTVFDSTGRQVAFADDHRFLPDPVLFFQPPADGEYTLELRDVVYRGRGDFIYRLTMGALPYYTDVFPLGGQRGTDVAVQYRGVNLTETRGVVRVPASGPRTMMVNGLQFGASDYSAVREAGGQRRLRAGAADVAPLPSWSMAQRRKAGVSHYFVLAANRNDKLVLEVQARRMGAPLDSVLTLFDARRNQVAENDDWNDPLEAGLAHNADSRILYTFPAAGDYYLRLRDIQGKGGEEYSFRLTVAPPRPDFTLRISPDNPRMGQGDTAAITVTAVRHDDFAGEIKLAIENLPGGYLMSEALIAAGQNEGAG